MSPRILGGTLAVNSPRSIGRAGGQFLVLVGQHLDAGPGHGGQAGVGGGPDEQVALALLGHEADVRDQDVALGALELAGTVRATRYRPGSWPWIYFSRLTGVVTEALFL